MLQKIIIPAVCALTFLLPGSALAIQPHGAPEGLYVHQMSHIFFFLSMCLLIYWMRARKMTEQAGWKFIQYSAVFFMIWTMDAFVAHLLDEQYEWVRVIQDGAWILRMETAHPIMAVVYYGVKLDHIWCVPGMFFLLLGLKRLRLDQAIHLNKTTGEK
jgi:hypothetical protein